MKMRNMVRARIEQYRNNGKHTTQLSMRRWKLTYVIISATRMNRTILSWTAGKKSCNVYNFNWNNFYCFRSLLLWMCCCIFFGVNKSPERETLARGEKMSDATHINHLQMEIFSRFSLVCKLPSYPCCGATLPDYAIVTNISQTIYEFDRSGERGELRYLPFFVVQFWQNDFPPTHRSKFCCFGKVCRVEREHFPILCVHKVVSCATMGEKGGDGDEIRWEKMFCQRCERERW